MELIQGCTTRPFGDADAASIFNRIATAGFSDVAIFNNIGIRHDSSKTQVTEVRAAAVNAGIRPSLLLVHAELDTDDPDARYRRMIDNAVILGAEWILDLGTGNPKDLDRYIDVMKKVLPHAEDAGIRISAKPHGGITLTADDLITLHERVHHPFYGICFDPGNIIYYTKGDARPETDIERIAPIVTTGIVKDCLLRDGEPDVMITFGEGLVEFQAVLTGLIGGGFRGPLYLECVGGDQPAQIDENVRSSRKMIESILSSS